VIRDPGGTCYAEKVRNETGKKRFTVIVLDPEVLLKWKASAWATWKERRVCKAALSREIDLNVMIEKTAEDSLENAIISILHHEIGHTQGMASDVHPSWNGDPAVSDACPFTKLSSRMKGKNIESRYDGTFFQRKAISPYAFEKATITMAEAAGICRQLADTNLPTIHAASSVWKDFAESFTHYLHAVREGKPRELRLRDAGMPDALFSACWNEGRCDAKRIFLEKWLADPQQ
jgi:hypothetical protein